MIRLHTISEVLSLRSVSRRALSGLLVLCLLVGIFASSFEVQAKSDLVYLFINDMLIQSLTASNMPLRINNSMYISYRYLLQIKPIKYYYDEDIRILKVYTSDGSLIFDVGNSITYDQNGRIYSYLAEIRNGVLYIPIEFICRFFGASYSQFSSDLGPVIRINSGMSLYENNELITANREAMEDLYADYYPASAVPSVPAAPTTPVTPTPEPPAEIIRPHTIYPMICGPLNEHSQSLMSAMDSYNVHATFFLSSEGLAQQGELLRRLICSGHGLGLYVSAADPVAEAEAGNALLSSMVFRKTRLVCIREGSKALTAEQCAALAAAGYRIWDGILDPGTADRSGYTVGVNGRQLLQNAPASSSLLLYPTEGARDSIYTLLRYMQENLFTALAVGDWTTPINSIRNYN